MKKSTSVFQKIKRELFFIYRLLDPRHTPACAGSFRCYFNYFKNRFFGRYLLNSFQGFKFDGHDDFEIHFLCQKNDVWMAVWSLYSFLYFSGLKPVAIVIHDDGSIDHATAKMLESKFSRLRVISRSNADELILSKLANRGKIYEYRKMGHPLNLKLIDPILLQQGASKIMVMDTDILFFRPPEEIINFIRGDNNYDSLLWGQTKKGYDMSIVNHEYLENYGILKNGAEYLQGSLNIFPSDTINLNKLEEYYNNCNSDFNFYFTEAAGWVSLLGQLNFKLLPVDRYIVKGIPSDRTVAKHFTSPRRHEIYAYGIDLIKRKLLG